VNGCRTLKLEGQFDLELTLAPLRRGWDGDHSVEFRRDGFWRAARTPSGPGTIQLWPIHSGVAARAWGPGADWLLTGMPDLVGANDSIDEFRPHPGPVADLRRRHLGMRMTRGNSVFETLLPTVLEQKVAGPEARYAYNGLVAAYGEAAPGPAGLRLPPTPDRLAHLPYWEFHRFGVERRRADVIKGAAARASRLEALLDLPPSEAARRLGGLPGIGVWSTAEILRVAFGDADAVSVGDYHLPHLVAFALTGRARGTDEEMLRLLEPYRGQRGRVQRLLEISGIWPPRFGPRMPFRRIQRF
jgi:3-methyladenine DNA glycosylase/8-oxoguanine DNA glycosylase